MNGLMTGKNEITADDDLSEPSVLESEEEKPSSDAGNGPIPQEVLDKLPEPMQSTIKETMIGFGTMSAPNPIAKKITPEHITQLIENDANESDRGFRFRENGRRYTFAYVLIAIATFFGLAYMFAKDDPELFKQIVSHIVVLFGGFAAGWGFKASKNSDED